jgi:hypothetical protein
MPRLAIGGLSAVIDLVGYKFELYNQPIAHLKLQTGSGTGSTGLTRWYLIYCKAWHSIKLQSIVDNDIFDSVFLITLIFLLALIALIILIVLIALITLIARIARIALPFLLKLLYQLPNLYYSVH